MRSLAVSLFGWIGLLACVLVIAGIAVGIARVTHASVPIDTLYGVEVDRIFTLDQNDGSVTALANHPEWLFSGLAFDSAGRLFASGCIRGSAIFCDDESLLLELDPLTGAIADTIGFVTDGSGSNVRILRLSVQPETDVLFGFGYNPHFPYQEAMWTIDKSTATATPIAFEVPAGCNYGINCTSNIAFGFATDGMLYHIYRNGDESALMTLDPSTGAELTSVPITPVPDDRPYSFHSLAVRSDGAIFSPSHVTRFPPPCPVCPPPNPSIAPPAMSTIDPSTGVATEVWTSMSGSGAGLAFSPAVVESVEIDIKPGSDPNAVNPTARGILPVAILGSDTFDVADVDATTVAFGPGEAAPLHSSGGHAEDVNDDGFIDWVSHYRIEEVAVAAGDSELCLTGETLDGIPIEGCDAIVTVPYVGERRRVRVSRQR